MSNYPNSLDDDVSLPIVNDNITEIGGDAINALRDAVFNIEQTLGLNLAGTTPSLANRLGIFINPDGTPNSSILTSLGLVTLPITNPQISNNAGIVESKLILDYRTQDLFNYIRDLSRDVNIALGWIAVTGVKLEPHLMGAIYRHDLAQIDVAEVSTQFLNNKFRQLRDNTSAYSLANDMNNELLAHQWADGSPFGIIKNVTTNDGSTYPSNFAHTAGGIFLDTTRFQIIPQTANSAQLAWDFIDQASVLTLGTRIQNLYASGISRNSRSSSLPIDGYGQALIPLTPAITYLRDNGNASIPFDDIAMGDDIIQLMPTSNPNFTFDEQFANVRVGDIIRVNYGADGYNVEIAYVIAETKYIPGSPSTFFVRIVGKNIAYSNVAFARIDSNLFNNNKYGVLAIAGVNATNLSSGTMPSLIVGSPRGAQCLGVGFSPDEFNETHYNLYLSLYPDGNPLDGYTFLPAIDVTGNQGITPGSYTLDSIVAATNLAFRQPGFNYRFIAFSYQGEFGIMLADSYNNASFSIVSGVVAPGGTYNQAATQLNFPNNAIDLFPIVGMQAPDPLGLGPFGAGLASPPLLGSYGSAVASQTPTIVFPPLRRNNFYVDGAEQEILNAYLGDGQVQDIYGDGYWVSSISSVNPGSGHVAVTYSIPLDLSPSGLKAGKTIVVQALGGNNFGLVDYGRFIIQSVTFSCCPPVQTEIMVYDAAHAYGSESITLPTLAPVGSPVAVYFSADSVSFNQETATDFNAVAAAFKRHFEVYVDNDGNTFTHERGRFNPNGTNGSTITVNGVILYGNSVFNTMDIIAISPKLRGYQFGSINKINLNIISLNSTGFYTGYLSSFDGTNYNSQGPTITGKVGEITRFYDNSNIDYIDLTFSLTTSSFIGQYLDIQLFPTLSLDEEVMLLGSCEVNMSGSTVSQFVDLRQFGNISEEELSTSALDFIALPDKLLHLNGIVRGFDFLVNNNTQFPPTGYATGAAMSFNGGLALVDGKFNFVNPQMFLIPALQEMYSATIYPINYALCVDANDDLVTIVLTDYDSILGTPNLSSRIVTVKNLVSGNTYQVDSSTFSTILNSRKDLAPLYIISATVTGTGITATTTITNVRDVRRYVNDSDANIPAVLTNDSSQGNFKNIASALNWLKFNSAFQNTLQIKGSYTVTNDPGLNFPLTIDAGAATSSLTFSVATAMIITDVTINNTSVIFSPAITATNSTFNDLSITFSSALTATNVTFNNCTVTITGASALSNVTFNNCTVVFSAAHTFTNVDLINSIVTFSVSSILNGSNIDSSIINITGGFGLTVSQFFAINSDFIVSVVKGFSLGANVVFDSCTFAYNVDPTTASSPTFVSSDLVNAGSGMMFANNAPLGSIPGNGSNLFIENCTFTTTSLSTSTSGYHFPFISIQLTSPGSILSDVVIKNNTFNTITNTSVNDKRAIISIIANTNTPPFGCSELVNVIISDNICNLDQMILISTVRPGTGAFLGVALATAGCRVSGNTCGTIGFVTQANSVNRQDNSYNESIHNKEDHLIIENNTCKFIANIDYKGSAIIPYTGPSTFWPTQTGPHSIIGNTANWIHTFCSSNFSNSVTTQISDGAIISLNRLSPADPVYLSNFLDLVTGLTPPNTAILLRNETLNVATTTPMLTQSIINNNIVNERQIYDSNSGYVSLYYDVGISCLNNANIKDNTINGCVNVINTTSNVTNAMMVLGNNANVHVTGNILNRQGLGVSAYILGPATSTSSAIITKNVFDSPYIDVANTIETVGVSIPTNWTYISNKNQTAYSSVRMLDLFSGLAHVGSGSISYGLGFDELFNLDSSVSIISQTASGTTVNFIFTGDISKYVPNDVYLLYSVIGVNTTTSSTFINTADNNTVQYTLWQDNPASFSISNPSSTGGSFLGSLANQTSYANLTAASTYNSPVITIAGTTATNQTVTAGSNITLPAATINVVSTAGFPAGPGVVSIQTATNGIQNVFYTTTTPTSFNGCFDGIGTVLSGSNVISYQVAATTFQSSGVYTWIDLSTAGWNTFGNQRYQIYFNAVLTTQTSPVEIAVSPLLIKYRW
jgi:hypothetical protein